MAIYEDFELSVNIATGCNVKTNHAKEECRLNIQGLGSIFTGSASICDYTVDDGKYNVCYHVPIDSNKLFTS